MKRIDVVTDSIILKSLIFLYTTEEDLIFGDVVDEINKTKNVKLLEKKKTLIDKYFPDFYEILKIEELIKSGVPDVMIIVNVDIDNLNILYTKHIIYYFTEIKTYEQCISTENGILVGSSAPEIKYNIEQDLKNIEMSNNFEILSTDLSINREKILKVISYRDVFGGDIVDKKTDINMGNIKLFFPYIYFTFDDYHVNKDINDSNFLLYNPKDYIKLINDDSYKFMSASGDDSVESFLKTAVVRNETESNKKISLKNIFDNIDFTEELNYIDCITSVVSLRKINEKKFRNDLRSKFNFGDTYERDYILFNCIYDDYSIYIKLEDNYSLTFYYDFSISRSTDVDIDHLKTFNEHSTDWVISKISPILKFNKKPFTDDFCNVALTFDIILNDTESIYNNIVVAFNKLKDNTIYMRNGYVIQGINNYDLRNGIEYEDMITKSDAEILKAFSYSTLECSFSSNTKFIISGIKNKRELEFITNLVKKIKYNIDVEDELNDSDKKNNAKQLSSFDDLTFGKSNNPEAGGYARKCQKPHQPVIANKNLIKSLTAEEKKRLFAYVNVKTGAKVQYWCPNEKYGNLNFLPGQKYCIICCAKKVQKQEIMDYCRNNQVYPSEADIKKVRNENYSYVKNINLNKKSEEGKSYLHPLLSKEYNLEFVFIEGNSIINFIPFLEEKTKEEVLFENGIKEELLDPDDTFNDKELYKISNLYGYSVIIIDGENLSSLDFKVEMQSNNILDKYVILFKVSGKIFLIKKKKVVEEIKRNNFIFDRPSSPFLEKILENIDTNIVFGYRNNNMLLTVSDNFKFFSQLTFDGMTIALEVVHENKKYVVFIEKSIIDFSAQNIPYKSGKLMSKDLLNKYLMEFNEMFGTTEEITQISYKKEIIALSFYNVKIICDNTKNDLKYPVYESLVDLKKIYFEIFSKENYKLYAMKDEIKKSKNEAIINIYLYKIICFNFVKYISKNKLYKDTKPTKVEIQKDLEEIFNFTSSRPKYSNFNLDNVVIECKEKKFCGLDIHKALKNDIVDLLFNDVHNNNLIDYVKKNISLYSVLDEEIYKIKEGEKIIVL